MLKYVIKRLFIFIPTIFLIITISFFLMRIAPGSPFDSERGLSPEIEANILKAYNMDKPLFFQYTDYLGNILKGDFGPSMRVKDFTVTELILNGFPVSLQLGLMAIICAIVIGIFMGTTAALNRNSHIDHITMAFSTIGIVIPNYVVAPILTLILGVYLGILPVGGWGEGAISHKILPIVTLALPQIAYVSRLTRGNMIEVLNSNYIRTAYAKGIDEKTIILRHALPGALLPILSYLGPATAAVVTGSVVIETIFDIPGIGRFFVNGALNRDYTLVMGVVIFYASLIILLNLIVDILYSILDPRVKF